MDYNNYTISYLRKECKQRGIYGYSKLKKTELIYRLECYDKSDSKNLCSDVVCSCKTPGTKIYHLMCKICQKLACDLCNGLGLITTWPPLQKKICEKCNGTGKLFK